MADHDRDLSHLSRKEKVRSSFNCLPHCRFHHLTAAAKSRAFRNSSQHFKINCSDFISRIGARDGRRRSASFHYDPLSYAMNFEDGYASIDDRYTDSLIRRDCAGRLSSPTRISPSDSSRPRELAAFS